jgi:acyl carrier protein/NADP-dependent 3-hydroxy acid dehydrogenase YdfG
VLITRLPFPEKNHWNQWLDANPESDKISKTIRQLQAIEAHGGEVLMVTADVANRAQMRKAVAAAYAKFGVLHGVIHAAGVSDLSAYRSVDETTRLDCERHFRPKIKGALVLDEVLRGKPIDFCMLMSSLSATLGGIGFVAYAAANRYLDAFALKQRASGHGEWISVAWDAWQSAGVPAEAANPVAFQRRAITAAEGAEAFERILGLRRFAQVIVSISDLQRSINHWVEMRPNAQQPEPLQVQEARRHTRASSQPPYVAPTNDIERAVMQIWQGVLGIEKIGIHDDFFDLGGDSLVAVKLVAHLRERFIMAVPLMSILQSPTVAQIAERIAAGMRPSGSATTPDEKPGARSTEAAG